MEDSDLWLAMRETKYRRTMESVSAILNDDEADPIAMVEDCFKEIVEAVHAETGTLWIFQKYGDGLIHPMAVYKGNLPRNFTIRMGEGIAGKSIQDCKGFIISDCQKDSRWAGKADSKTGFVTKSMLCVPIVTSTGGFGCIQIINKSDGFLFDNRDFEFATQLTNDVTKLFEDRHITDKLQGGKQILYKLSFDDVLCADSDAEALKLLEELRMYKKLIPAKQRRFKRLALKLRECTSKKQ